MTTIEIISGIVLLLCSVAIVLSVLFQSSKSSGMSGAIMGGTGETVRGRGRALDEKLSRITRFLAVVFFVITIVVNIIALVVGAE